MAKRTHMSQASHIELMVSFISKEGGITTKADCIRRYGEELVEDAIRLGKAKATVVKWVDPNNKVRPLMIDAISIAEWKGDRPIWLDHRVRVYTQAQEILSSAS